MASMAEFNTMIDGTVCNRDKIHTVGHPVLSDARDLEQFVGSSTDITERKSAEQERNKLRQLEADLAHTNRVSMLGEMAASLAHEIKQPITAAITSANSCIEWLAHEPPNLTFHFTLPTHMTETSSQVNLVTLE